MRLGGLLPADRLSIIAAPLRNNGSFGPCLQRGTHRHALVLASTPTADAHKLVLGAVVPNSLRLAGALQLSEHPGHTDVRLAIMYWLPWRFKGAS